MKFTTQHIAKTVVAILSLLLCIVLKGTAQSVSTVPQGSVVYRQQLGAGFPAEATLVFTGQRSLFYCNRKDVAQASMDMKQIEQTDEKNSRYEVDTQDREGHCTYTDRAQNIVISRQYELPVRQNLLIEEPLPALSWTITNNTKTVGTHRVQLATTSFRGRKYEAWFAPDLPLPLGPWKLGGLPGLILEAYDSERRFSFEAVSIDIPARDQTPVVAPTQGQRVVGWPAYVALTTESANRMTKMMQARPGVSFKINREGSLEIIE